MGGFSGSNGLAASSYQRWGGFDLPDSFKRRVYDGALRDLGAGFVDFTLATGLDAKTRPPQSVAFLIIGRPRGAVKQDRREERDGR